jgi:hypothetical protein
LNPPVTFIPGNLLQAVRKQYCVIILNIIGDYDHWTSAKGPVQQLRETSIRLAGERGIDMRFLNCVSMHSDVNAEAVWATGASPRAIL